MAPSQFQALMAAIQVLNEKVDVVAEAVQQQGGRLDLHDYQLERLNSGYDDLTDTTSRHELTATQKALESQIERTQQLEAGRSYWVRGVIAGVFTIVLAIAGWIVKG